MAFTFSAERLFSEWPNIYFWTFTFRSVPIDDSFGMDDWSALARRLQDRFAGIKGLRVVELHRSHGIHFHVFVNMRIPMRRMRKIVYGTGHINGHNRYLDFGRMWVVKCDKGPRSIAYLANYLTKAYRRDNWFGNRRRWGTIGGFNATRVRDVEYHSVATENRKLIFGHVQCSYVALVMVTHFSNLWGHVKDWPIEDLRLIVQQPLASGADLIKHRLYNEPF